MLCIYSKELVGLVGAGPARAVLLCGEQGWLEALLGARQCYARRTDHRKGGGALEVHGATCHSHLLVAWLAPGSVQSRLGSWAEGALVRPFNMTWHEGAGCPEASSWSSAGSCDVPTSSSSNLSHCSPSGRMKAQ